MAGVLATRLSPHRVRSRDLVATLSAERRTNPRGHGRASFDGRAVVAFHRGCGYTCKTARQIPKVATFKFGDQAAADQRCAQWRGGSGPMSAGAWQTEACPNRRQGAIMVAAPAAPRGGGPGRSLRSVGGSIPAGPPDLKVE